jgi:5-methylcytosine-specific restriction endonuclease McrA
MQRVFVLSNTKKPLMPCHPARARELLRDRKAAVYRRIPFTIILKDRVDGDLQPLELKVDPGSKTTGISLVGEFKRGRRVIFGANLSHRGQAVRDALESRRSLRRSRRARKTRYRAPRFLNRRRQRGWLPPSLRSRVDNVQSWGNKLISFSPLSAVAVETVRFDTQKMENPEISGVEYQQGELLGYEVREYLLEKWGRRCTYCGKDGVPLQVEHIHPRCLGGSNRVSNLTLACRPCNEKKGSHPIEDFLKGKKDLLGKIMKSINTQNYKNNSRTASRFKLCNTLPSPSRTASTR